MSKTREILDRIPEANRKHLEGLKEHYNADERFKKETRLAGASYLKCMMDLGVITELEKRFLFSYITL